MGRISEGHPNLIARKATRLFGEEEIKPADSVAFPRGGDCPWREEPKERATVGRTECRRGKGRNPFPSVCGLVQDSSHGWNEQTSSALAAGAGGTVVRPSC